MAGPGNFRASKSWWAFLASIKLYSLEILILIFPNLTFSKTASAPAWSSFLLVKYWPIEGLVITRYGHYTETRFVEVIEAAHPQPDEISLLASQKIFNIATNSSKLDHVVFLISGGASSLLTLPLSGISCLLYTSPSPRD